MVRRRRRSKKMPFKSIMICICVLLFLVMISECSNKSSKVSVTPDLYAETPPPPTETKLSGMDIMNATRWTRHTEVQPTIERRKIESTMTWAVLFTNMPTEKYLSTVYKQETQAVQQATMEVLMTEASIK